LARIIGKQNFTRALRGFAIVLLVMVLAGSVVGFALFSGPNLTQTSHCSETSPFLQKVTQGDLVLDGSVQGTTLPIVLPLCRINVDPGLCGKLLISFDYKIENCPQDESRQFKP